MKKIDGVHQLLDDPDFSEKVQLVFATKTTDASFDPYSKNYTYTNLSPIVIRGLIRYISPEALVWKQYGIEEMGAIEIITKKRYKTWFENCREVIYESDKYQVLKDATGDKSIIQVRPNSMIRVVLSKK